MKFWVILLAMVVGAAAWAAELVSKVEIDGKMYESVRWGPVNRGKIVVLHSRGSAFVPVEKIPEPYRSALGITATATPATPAEIVLPVVEPAAESAFARAQRLRREREAAAQAKRDQAAAAARARWTVIDGTLVEKQELTQLTGFVRNYAEARDGDKLLTRGVIVERAERRDPTKKVPALFEMRPGLWRETGEQVFLQDYEHQGQIGDLIRVYGREQSDRVQDMRAFIVGRDPTAAEVAGR